MAPDFEPYSSGDLKVKKSTLRLYHVREFAEL